jgi:hypothetical protein
VARNGVRGAKNLEEMKVDVVGNATATKIQTKNVKLKKYYVAQKCQRYWLFERKILFCAKKPSHWFFKCHVYKNWSKLLYMHSYHNIDH